MTECQSSGPQIRISFVETTSCICDMNYCIKTLTHMRGVYCLWLVSVLSHSLSLNKIGDEGMIAMSQAACHWTNLQELE